jgi:hypothetical protein
VIGDGRGAVGRRLCAENWLVISRVLPICSARAAAAGVVFKPTAIRCLKLVEP